ncbi:MAG: DUF488 domain-containing protein [Rhodopirellula sp.]|nr:DUF488 domain-containing protein [Rhodopirellula sp.]
MEIYTIGFTQTGAAEFFGKLKRAGVRRLVDVRLNNRSQLAGFAKRDDLEYFLAEICGADYIHEPRLAPSQEILDAYKKGKGSWQQYEVRFLQLLADRRIEAAITRSLFEVPAVLLCSERTAEHCHRRLVLEYLNRHWGDVRAVHL